MTEILFLLLHILLLYCEILRSSGGGNSIDGYFLLCGYYFNVICHSRAVPLAENLFSHFIEMAMPTTTENSNSKKMDGKTLSKAQMRFNFSLSGLSLVLVPGEDRSRIRALVRCS